jgi:hypothetical protein
MVTGKHVAVVARQGAPAGHEGPTVDEDEHRRLVSPGVGRPDIEMQAIFVLRGGIGPHHPIET